MFKRGIGWGLGAALAAVVAIPLAAGAFQAAAEKPEADQVVKDLSFPLIKDLKTPDAKGDGAIKLADAKEKVIVLCAMSQACSVSWRYEKRLGELIGKYGKNKDVRVVGLYFSQGDTPDSLSKWYDTRNMPVTVATDAGAKFVRSMGWRSTPNFAVLGKDEKGAYRLRYHGSFDDHADGARATKTFVPDAVEAILAGKDVKVKSSYSVFG